MSDQPTEPVTEPAPRYARRSGFTLTQLVSLGAGLFFGVSGGVVLAKTGLNLTDITGGHVSILGLHHTTLLGLIEIILGIALIAGGSLPGARRANAMLIGVLLLGFGLVVVIVPRPFHDVFGMHAIGGWAYAIIGAVLLGSTIPRAAGMRQ